MKRNKMPTPLRITILLVFVGLIVFLVNVQVQYNQLEETKKEIEAQVEAVELSIEELQNRLDTPFDDEYIISLAKDKLNYCLSDEIIFYSDLIS